MLSQNLCDVLFLSETKLDESFPNSSFRIPNFSKPIRSDRNCNGGGLMALIRSDLAHRHRTDIELLCKTPIECLVLEMIVRKQKWLSICLYNPKSQYKSIYCDVLDDMLNTYMKDFHTVYVIGD